ncbi:MAG: hypothetical protein AAGF20_05665 [Pseudomonadota bacterium]
MAKTPLPDDTSPLNPLGYWQESLATWMDFGRRNQAILMDRVKTPTSLAVNRPDLAETETLTSEMMRNLADMNLRHWQNTARFLDGLPEWWRSPSVMGGAALTDWFDKMRRTMESSTSLLSEPGSEPEVAETKPAGPKQPEALSKPLGTPDDLTKIKGIGAKLNSTLNELGIFHFKQIASWGDDEAAWIDDYLAFKGRVAREDWIAQAKAFAANGSATMH